MQESESHADAADARGIGRSAAKMAVDSDMTADGYRAQVRRLGLRPTTCSTGQTTIHLSAEGEPIPVANPEWQTPTQRVQTIERLKARLGVGLGTYRGLGMD